MTRMEQLIEQAKSISVETWIGYLAVICIVLILVAQYALRWAVLAACFLRRGWIATVLHPQNFRKGSLWQERAEQLLAWLDGLAWPERVSAKIISSPQRDYELGARCAFGDVSDIYRGRSGGRSYLFKVSRVAGGDVLLEKEQEVLQRLQCHASSGAWRTDLPVPVELFRSGHRMVSAFELPDGFVAATDWKARTSTGADARQLEWVFCRMMQALGFAHENGWIHGAVLPPHLLLREEDREVMLIGWTQGVPIGTPIRLVSRAFKPWYPPECHRRDPATAATDIYLAAKSTLWLAGVDPLQSAVPSHLPSDIRRLLERCLESSPARRPQDAGLLCKSLNEVSDRPNGPTHSLPSIPMKRKGAHHGYHTLV